MKQADLGLHLSTKRTRKREFLDEMERVVPWADLAALIAGFAPEGKRGRPPFALHTMLRIHFMQQWFGLSDPAMEEALHDIPMYRDFAQLDWTQRLPDETTILRFRHLLEEHKLADQMLSVVNDMLGTKGLLLRKGAVVDATLIAAPSSTKNASGERDPAMHQTKKGNQWYFGMKAHIGVDAESGLVHTVKGTPANANDVTEANALLHGDETDAFGDAGYQGAAKRPDAKETVNWHIAMRPGKRAALDKTQKLGDLLDQVEKIKASIRAKVEHPFRVIKRQFGFVNVRYRGDEEEHRPAQDLVHAEQFVDGAKEADGVGWSGVSANGEWGLKWGKRAWETPQSEAIAAQKLDPQGGRAEITESRPMASMKVNCADHP